MTKLEWLLDGFLVDHEGPPPLEGGPLAVHERGRDDAVKTVGILGGGSAGFLTALALRARLPYLEVSIIESSQIPIIGVGESTTTQMIWFLHRFLGLDIHDFYRKVQPTWKQGIKFVWGQPGDYHFQAPFEWGRNGIGLLGSLKCDGNINAMTIQSLLMERDATAILRADTGRYVSFLHELAFAYHLDNPRLVRYLHEAALAAGVAYLDRKIADARVSPDGESIDHLVSSEGETFRFDLYIDCSGFRSLLLEKKLGSRFLSYASSLFTDRAIAFNAPHDGVVKPYTTALTMDSGWAWIIPQEDLDHLGYVYSSPFSSDEQAMDAVETMWPDHREARVIQFRSGRHEESWKGNVVAIGNAYAFVEPLESTGLMMICSQIYSLVQLLPTTPRQGGMARTLYNDRYAKVWDGLRWFLSIHYKFNNRLETPFWQAARAKTDVSRIQPMIDAYQEGGPIAFRSPRFKRLLNAALEILFFGVAGFDCILAGQKVPARLPESREGEAAWRERKRLAELVIATAIGQGEALGAVREHPEFLDALLEHPESWVQHSWRELG